MARSKLPIKWNPNTSLTEYDRQGNRIRRRYYGGDGYAIKNIDFQPHHGHPIPHVHDWDWTKARPRQAARPKRSGE